MENNKKDYEDTIKYMVKYLKEELGEPKGVILPDNKYYTIEELKEKLKKGEIK